MLLSGVAATAAGGGLERYRVMLALQPGDDLQVITSQPAGTYRLRVQPENAPQPSTMLVVASESSVEMLRRDRRVAGVEWVAESTAAVPGFGAFSYDGAGNITAVGDDTFIYDNVGRLKKATLGTNTEEYTYDRYGNLETVKTGTVTKTLGVQASSNRMDRNTADLYATYDARGNVTQTSAGATFAYDGTDVVKAAMFDGANHQYLYTAGDERIGTITSVSGNIVRWDFTVRDPAGKILRRFAKASDGTWSWEEDYIYRDGQLLAAEVPRSDKTLHFHLDHLGTPRVITGNGGAQIALHTYYPFGTELTSPAQDPEAMKFTGHERDAAALDYMHARYYNAGMRRFLSVDPSPKLRLQQPQSWNRYAYSLNNPLKYVDPDGRDAVVFIVSSGPQWNQKGGHAAIWVESGIRHSGVSRGGYNIAKNGWKDFLAHYTGQGREVHAYILKTTDAQDQAMLNFIEDRGDAAGTDANKSVQTCGLTENCASAVVNVLQAGGVVPANSDPSAARGANSPFVLKNELDNGQLKPQVQRHIDFVPPQPEKKESWWSRLWDRIF